MLIQYDLFIKAHPEKRGFGFQKVVTARLTPPGKGYTLNLRRHEGEGAEKPSRDGRDTVGGIRTFAHN
ncbi:hypothetical protein NUW58_g10786 [Xylaria curta]|uniref:Uncharacterized protein n=1 Tax=Xylaria curta TaxID=42375 RepID=A0ACC1MHG2_9PEZI|nr:hypothetical protein NUW58_g10786 [Xylaria curta]